MPGTKERLIEVVGTAAGAAADPRTGLSKARTRLLSSRTAVLCLCVAAAYVIGRRVAGHGRK
ncbi:hypothetical protein ACQP1P_26955 [Dactylosporangium sp. CA-052675]|uniref:hypothetical protein n=1 Tax=Dactylosporangium sp. CA-052675 TaxID=3239927 RepID=UPI003D8E68A0